MPSTQSIRAGRAFVELFADDSKLVRGLRSAEKKLKAFGDGVRNLGLKMMGMGAAILAPLAASAKAFGTMGDQVAKMSKRTGLSVETLSELRFVASQTGTEFESLEMAFRKMQRSIYDAGRGLSTQVDALKDLGLTFQDLDGLSPEEQFKLLGEAISQIEDPTKKAAIAMSLFGRTGTNLLPMFARGAKGIEELQEEARRLGLTMSTKDAKAAEDFIDAMDKLWKTVKMGVFHVGSALGPVLTEMAEQLATTAAGIARWVRENRGLIVSIAKIGAGILAAGAAVTALGLAIKAAGVAFGGMAAILALVLSPLGAVLAAVAALGVWLVTSTSAGGKALAWLGGRFAALAEYAKESLGGIADALAAGDITLAAKILWQSLKVVWLKGIEPLEKRWHEFVFGAKALWTGLKHGLLDVWYGLVAGLKNAWAGFVRMWRNTTETTAGWIAKRMLEVQGLFDDTLDVEFAKRSVDSQVRQRKSEIDAEARQAQRANDEEYNRRVRENQERRNRELDRLNREHESKIDAARRELEQAKRQRDELLRRAREKRKLQDDGGPGDGEDLLAGLRAQLAGAGDLLAGHARRIGARGTFLAANVQGLQAGSAVDRMADGIDRIERNTRPLRDSQGLSFE